MNNRAQWLYDLEEHNPPTVEGLVSVAEYDNPKLWPEQRAIIEKARAYEAQYVFFEASRDGRPPVPQAFVFVSDNAASDDQFAQLHKRLWSWGGVPLAYRKTAGLVQLFRCAHKPDFEQNGKVVLYPFEMLRLGSAIAAKNASRPWWDADRLRNGTLWDDPLVCKQLLSNRQSAQKTLIKAVRDLHEDLIRRGVLPRTLRRRLLILSILIAYLEARGVFEDGFFAQFKRKARSFFEVLADTTALLKLLDHLQQRFNGNVFVLKADERDALRNTSQLELFARLVEGREEKGGQLTLWERYSFADLPVELISHIYQLFVKDSDVEVYTPHFVVRLMLGEVLSWERLDRLEKREEVILDGACGSGIFLVEAYKRLVLHWRYRNNWKSPSRATLTKLLTTRLRGIDIEEGAVELTAFSLCLALCDALEPKDIRTSIKLFPPLKEETIHTSCFFEALEHNLVQDKIGVVVGNPPFTSRLGTAGARRAYDHYLEQHGALPDKQLAYLFLHEGMRSLAPGGALCMLQQYNFLYNQQSREFRRAFIEHWDLREILDFISIRGLFQKGDADTKVIVIVAEAKLATGRQILHATFRRTGRTDAEQGFEIDYYDMHWLPRELALANDSIWRSNLLGGGRVLGFVDRLAKLRTIGQFAEEMGWNMGEGFTPGSPARARKASHVVGKQYVDSSALREGSVDLSLASTVPNRPIERPRKREIYEAPLLLIHKQMDIPHGYLARGYVTYQHEIFGISAAGTRNQKALHDLARWLGSSHRPLLAYIAAASVAGFISKATAILSGDIKDLPYPGDGDLDIAPNEAILVADIVDYYRDLVRLGEDSNALKSPGVPALSGFNQVFAGQINGIYRGKPLKPLAAQTWPGVICQPFMFGEGQIDWSGSDDLKGKINALLREKRDGGVNLTRIARIYDGSCIFLVKPDRLRYWLRSVALRDADETLADLRDQGY